ncbi:MAG TPA: hypothetical protein VK211_18770 [Kamptonema sp.]|nr:hypothetical protein [Kamptonema sp.]
MADISFTNEERIGEIINRSSRLKYILTFTYKISLDDVISVRVDGDNFKIDVNTEAEIFRFKAQGVENVIMKNPKSRILELTFDPALAQAIYNIIDEYV